MTTKEEMYEIHERLDECDSYEEKIETFDEWALARQVSAKTIGPLLRIEAERLLDEGHISDADMEEISEYVQGEIT